MSGETGESFTCMLSMVSPVPLMVMVKMALR